MQSFKTQSLVAFATLMATGSAHLTMVSPKPFPGTSGSGPSRSPLDPAGANYPCQATGADYYKAGSVSNTAAIGDDVPLKFDPLGTAVHGGGSCQVSLTTDQAPTKDSKWMVIHSIEGGCPSKTATGNLQPGQHADDYTFKIPDGIVAGQYVMAWTWFNKVGNREMYMNCAPFTITGGSGGSSSGSANTTSAAPAAAENDAVADTAAGSATGTSDKPEEASATADTSCDDEDEHTDAPAAATSTPAAGAPGMKRRIEARKEAERFIKRQNTFPNIYLANICGGQCTTTESTDVKFPDPGSSVEMFAPAADLKLQTCSCPGAGGAGGAASPAAGSGTPAASGTTGGSPSSAAGSPLGQATGSAAADGGASAGAATETAASTPEATAATSAPAAEAPTSAAAAAPTSAAAAAPPAASSAASGGSAGSSTGGGTQSCSGTNLVCSSDGTLFGICDTNGQALMRPVAPGTACVNGAIAAAAAGGSAAGGAAAGGASAPAASPAASAASAASSGGM